MNFLQGFVYAKKKFTDPKYQSISEMYIDRLENMIQEDEHLLTDDQGNIQVFNCELGDKQFKGVVKYKTGEKKVAFCLTSDFSDYKIILGDEKYSIRSIPSETGTNRVIFKDNGLVNEDTVVQHEHSEGEIILTEKNLKNDSLINFIKLNLENIVSPLPSLKYFCISHVDKTFGFIYSYHRNDHLHFTVLLLSGFYNPVELFPVILKIENVPFFKNDCFLIAKETKEIYLSCRISLFFDYSQDFLDKVTGSLLCEERIVFVSKRDILLKIKYLLRTLKPFKWSHSLIISDHLTKDLLESPLPFILGIPELVDFEDKITVIDLDKQTVKNNKMTIQANKDLSLRLANYFDSKKKYILENNLNNIQSVLLYPYRYFRDLYSIAILPEDEEYDYEFIRRFTSTRMFTRYITEERIGCINYIYDIKSGRLECLPYQNIDKIKLVDVLKIYTEIYELGNSFITKKIYEYAELNGLLEEMAPSIFRRLSISEDYEGIKKLFGKTKSKEIHKINIYERQFVFKIEEEDFDDLQIVKTDGSTRILKGGVSYNLYPLDSLFYIYTQEEDLRGKYPEVFYNLVAYFYYFNLPFSYEEFEYKIQI